MYVFTQLNHHGYDVIQGQCCISRVKGETIIIVYWNINSRFIFGSNGEIIVRERKRERERERERERKKERERERERKRERERES